MDGISAFLILLLFLNCVLTISMYNNSNCKENTFQCQSYLHPDKIIPMINKNSNTENNNTNNKNNKKISSGIINNINKATVRCGSIDSAYTPGNKLILGCSVIILIGSLVLCGVSLYKGSEDESDFIDVITNILLTISIIIISSFNFTIYNKCLNDITSCSGEPEYVPNMGIRTSCNYEVDNYNTIFNIYVIMIIVLCISILLGIYNVVSLSGHGFGGSSFL
jgi:hypothetical protein